MDISIEQYKQTITFIAKILNKSQNYKALLEANTGLEKISEMIAIDLFLKQEELYKSLKETQYFLSFKASSDMIKNFLIEIKTKGVITWKNVFPDS
jgi:hypothetical protein